LEAHPEGPERSSLNDLSEWLATIEVAPCRVADVLGHRRLFAALMQLRGNRRRRLWVLRRQWVGERTWITATWVIGQVAGSTTFMWRALHGDIDGPTWPEFQELMADSGDPPEHCRRFAAKEVDSGCHWHCTSPRFGHHCVVAHLKG
jgi:hypothetical protein